MSIIPKHVTGLLPGTKVRSSFVMSGKSVGTIKEVILFANKGRVARVAFDGGETMLPLSSLVEHKEGD